MVSTHTPHAARAIAPIVFTARDGHVRTVPVGPCLIEEVEDDRVLVVWGKAGDKSALMPATEAERARRDGILLLLD